MFMPISFLFEAERDGVPRCGADARRTSIGIRRTRFSGAGTSMECRRRFDTRLCSEFSGSAAAGLA
jgi:hypothetical protein